MHTSSSTAPQGSSPLARSKVSRWAAHFERRVRSRVCGGCGIFSRWASILQGSSLRETSAQYAYIVAGADGQRKRRTEEEVRVRQQATRMELLHTVHVCGRPRPESSSTACPAREFPRSRSKLSRWARHFERRVRSRVSGGWGIFSRWAADRW